MSVSSPQFAHHAYRVAMLTRSPGGCSRCFFSISDAVGSGEVRSALHCARHRLACAGFRIFSVSDAASIRPPHVDSTMLRDASETLRLSLTPASLLGHHAAPEGAFLGEDVCLRTADWALRDSVVDYLIVEEQSLPSEVDIRMILPSSGRWFNFEIGIPDSYKFL